KSEADARGFEYLLFGDYGIEPVKSGAVFPNRRLREAGLLAARSIKEMAYADFFSSRAFAMVDHGAAHVFTSDAQSADAAKSALRDLPGIAEILDRPAQANYG